MPAHGDAKCRDNNGTNPNEGTNPEGNDDARPRSRECCCRCHRHAKRCRENPLDHAKLRRKSRKFPGEQSVVEATEPPSSCYVSSGYSLIGGQNCSLRCVRYVLLFGALAVGCLILDGVGMGHGPCLTSDLSATTVRAVAARHENATIEETAAFGAADFRRRTSLVVLGPMQHRLQSLQ